MVSEFLPALSLEAPCYVEVLVERDGLNSPLKIKCRLPHELHLGNRVQRIKDLSGERVDSEAQYLHLTQSAKESPISAALRIMH